VASVGQFAARSRAPTYNDAELQLSCSWRVVTIFSRFSSTNAAEVARDLAASPTCHHITRQIAINPRDGNPSKN
jgi:hypothetical protein